MCLWNITFMIGRIDFGESEEYTKPKTWFVSDDYKTTNDVMDACIDKLIEIVKNKTNLD